MTSSEEVSRAAKDMFGRFRMVQTLIGALGWAGGMTLMGLILPSSLYVTAVILALGGIWITIVAFRANSLIKGGGSILQPLSRLGRIACLIFLSGASMPLFTLFVLVLGAGWILALVYGLLALPSLGIALWLLHSALNTKAHSGSSH